MGGCYTSSYGYRSTCQTTRPRTASVENLIKKFFRTNETKDLIEAYKTHTGSGFIKKMMDHKRIKETPKEFPEIEYEIKFSLQPTGEGKEPTLEEYLDTFEFPATKNARFIKDPVHTNARGTNHFFGTNGNEELVIIEKGGGTYLKEKSQPLELRTKVPFQEIVVKRTEDRYPTTTNDLIKKLEQLKEKGVEYKGYIDKDKGDDFILDTFDGRIYSYTITVAYKNGEEKQVQRQLEIEYAGYIPGFNGFEENSEEQIIAGMVHLAKFTALIGDTAPIKKNRSMRLYLTNERKYDFVSGNTPPELVTEQKLIPVMTYGK